MKAVEVDAFAVHFGESIARVDSAVDVARGIERHRIRLIFEIDQQMCIRDRFYRVPREKWDQVYSAFKAQTEAEHEEVVALGGLHIVATERHESRRIDNQLRGRSGRQGDPGSSRFFLSLQDDLLRIFGGERMQNLMLRLGMEEDVPIESKLITKPVSYTHLDVYKRQPG